MSNVKKWLALVMAVLMLATAVPFGVFAEEACTHEPVGVNKLEPTCTTDGHEEYVKCAKCGVELTEKKTIKSLGHDWVKGEKVEVTCLTDGYTPYTCSRCHLTENKDIVKAAGKHNYKETVIKEATCTEAGSKKLECDCGDNYTETIAKKNHNYVTTVVPPTCTAEGATKHVCSVCGDTYETDKTEKLGHNWGEWKVTQKGTCTDDEIREKICSRCNEKESDVKKAPGHAYKEEKVDATCTTSGKTIHTCSKCGDSYEDNVVAALGHLYYDDAEKLATCTETGLSKGRHCTRCDEVFVEQKILQATGHKEKKIPAVEPTCKKEGTTEKIICENCGLVMKESTSIPVSGHKFDTEVIIKATCTSDGLSKNVCEYCGYSENIIVEKFGHDFKEIKTKAPTCTEEGLVQFKCTRCGEKQEGKADKKVAALGHKWKAEWTVDRSATCTKDGLKSHHCSVCDAKNDITAIPKGHKYQEKVVKAATEKNAGQVRKVCKVCGDKQAATTVAKIKSIALSKTEFIYDGTARKPLVIVKDAKGKKLVNGTDYTVKYASGRKKVGSYKVTVTFKGKYSGTKALTFKIKLAKVTGVKATSKNNKVTFKYKKVAGAQKYIIYYSSSKDGNYKTLKTVTKLTHTTKALKTGKVYYFKVRAVTTNNAGKNAYGAPSAAVKVTIK